MKGKLEESVQEIKKMVGDLRGIAKQEIIHARKGVELIIHEKSRDSRDIENTLDHLFNLVLLGVGDKEFHELNDFYATFDSQGAESYKRFYEEMTGKKY